MSSMMRMFSGLMSRWKIPLRCMWSMARTSWYMYDLTWSSAT